MKALFATDMAGKPVARLELAEGAQRLDATLFVLRGNVPGAYDLAELDPVPSIAESGRRIDAAAREFLGMPPAAPPKRDEAAPPAPGSIAESAARIDAALAEAAGRPGPAAPARPSLPVVVVTRQPVRQDPAPARESGKPALGGRSGGTAGGTTVELRETPRPARRLGYVDYGGGRTEPAEFDADGRLIKIGGRTIR
jgi:hypothetical protein